MITYTNYLILIQNYIYSRLIGTSTSIIKIKMFMSNSENKTIVDSDSLFDNNYLEEAIRSFNKFELLGKFYNEDYIHNACKVSIDPIEEKDKFEDCLKDKIIISANNTDGLIEIVSDLIDNIYKEHSLQKDKEVKLKNGTKTKFFNELLFEMEDFSEIEEIFYKYLISINDIFAVIARKDLKNFLDKSAILVIILEFSLVLLICIYCVVFITFFIKQLIHYLSVSRSVVKIVPTSVIIGTQELQT